MKVEVRNRYDCCGERLSNSRVTLEDGASPAANYNIGTTSTNEILNIPESSFTRLVSLLNSFGASRQGRDSLTLTYLHLCDTASFVITKYPLSLFCLFLLEAGSLVRPGCRRHVPSFLQAHHKQLAGLQGCRSLPRISWRCHQPRGLSISWEDEPTAGLPPSR